MNTSKVIQVERTNFKGDWSEICPHCGDIQEKHKVTYGPFEGILHEHRMPCEPEKNKIRKKYRQTALTVKLIILIFWVLVPLAYIILQQFSKEVGWIAFGIGIIQLVIVTIKHFGNPDKWIPGHKKKREEELENQINISNSKMNKNMYSYF